MSQYALNLLVAVFSCFSILAAPVFAVGTSDDSSAETAAISGYDEAKALIDAGDYSTALPKLLVLTAAEPKNADAWNLLGYTHRKLGQFDDSALAYTQALTLNPDHLGALEYQGELFLQTGKPDLAKANLARIKGICGDCEESEDLEKAITAAGV